MSGEVHDVIVVGSGAAGSWAAKELCEHGVRVLLVEAGRDLDLQRDFPIPPGSSGSAFSHLTCAIRHRQHIQARSPSYTPRTSHFYVNDLENPYVTPRGKPFHWFRGRQLGGRLHTWSRCALRMSDREFKSASRNGYGADWPLCYGELAPFYERVEAFHGLLGSRDGVPHVPDGHVTEELRLTGQERAFGMRVEARFPGRRVIPARVLRPDPRRVPAPLAAALATGRLTVKTDTIVSRVLVDPETGNARGVACVDRLSKRHHEHLGRVVMLCSSTIESLRILLNSACPRHPDGLGNSSGLLGRCLMDHLMLAVDGSIGPVMSALAAVEPVGPTDPYDFALPGLYIPSFRNMVGRGCGFLGGYGVMGSVGRATPWWFLLAFGEMLPREENRVTLDGDRRDAWGIPVARIECAHSENDLRMIQDMHGSLREMAEAAGLRVHGPGEGWSFLDSLAFRLLRPWILTRQGAFFPGAAIHETGGARMGTDPRTSVLNPFHQCWDARNVFVTDGASFPSTGFQNITLTIMALTARACDFVVRELSRRNL